MPPLLCYVCTVLYWPCGCYIYILCYASFALLFAALTRTFVHHCFVLLNVFLSKLLFVFLLLVQCVFVFCLCFFEKDCMHSPEI